jgi:hypothetical protein
MHSECDPKNQDPSPSGEFDERLFARTISELGVDESLASDVRKYINGDRSVLNVPVEFDTVSGLQLPPDLSRVGQIARVARHYIAMRYPECTHDDTAVNGSADATQRAEVNEDILSKAVAGAPHLKDLVRRYLQGDNSAILDGSERLDPETHLVSADPPILALKITQLAALYAELLYGKPGEEPVKRYPNTAFEREISGETTELQEFARIAFYADYRPKTPSRRQLKPDEVERILSLVESFDGAADPKPSKDVMFEHFLDYKLADELDSIAAENVRRAARLAFYGMHYDRLFPSRLASVPETLPISSHPPARTFRPTMPVAHMARGQEVYEQFMKEHSDRVKPYL